MKVYAVARMELRFSAKHTYNLLGLFTNKKDAWIFIQNKLDEPLDDRFGYKLKNVLIDSSIVTPQRLSGARKVTNVDGTIVIYEFYRIKELELNAELTDAHLIFYGE